MKKILSILFLTLAVSSFSQVKFSKDFTVEAGKPFPVVDAGHKQYFGVGDNKSISIKTQGELVTIQKFDALTMKEVSRKVYEDFPKYTNVQRIIQSKDALFYIFEAYNKADKTFSV